MDDKDITEIMVNGKEDIFIEKKGRSIRLNKRFKSNEQLEDMIQQIVSEVNRVVNVSSPIADARLKDGSRVHIVLYSYQEEPTPEKQHFLTPCLHIYLMMKES